MTDTTAQTVAAPAPDATPVAAPAAADKQPDLSASQGARLRFLLDKDKEIQKKSQDLKQADSRVKWADDLIAAKQVGPMAVLQRLGITPAELAQHLQAQQPKDQVAQLEQKVSLLAERLEEAQKREEEYRVKSVMEEAQKNVTEYVKTAKEKYPFVTTLGAEGEVFKLIREQYQKNGTVMTEDEAASEIEKSYEGLHRRLSGVKGNVTQEQPAATQQPATLTNHMQSQPAPKRTPGELTPEERFAEAVKMLKFDEVT